VSPLASPTTAIDETAFRSKAVLERVESPARALAISSIVGICVGAFIVFLFVQADPRYHSGKSYSIGALIGFSTNVWSLLGQLAAFKLLRPSGRITTLACRFLPFFFGGGLGLATGTYAFGERGIGTSGALGLEHLAGFGMMSMAIGAVYESIETLKERLRASVAKVKEQEFAERELQAARSLQQRLMPRNEIDGEGYRIAARNVPSRVVSGDFYDVFTLASGRVCFAVGDVAGKGMSAGLIMASVKAMLPLIASENGVAETLRVINRQLHETLGSREFVALCLGSFDPTHRELRLANSGLPDLYRIDAAGETLSTLSVPGPRLPLGMRAEVPYDELAVELDVGDRVLCTTDGLPEAQTAIGEPLGYDALEKILQASTIDHPLAWIDTLFRTVSDQTTDEMQDDWTMLAIEAHIAES